jgi:hypothetical protein
MKMELDQINSQRKGNLPISEITHVKKDLNFEEEEEKSGRSSSVN